MSGTEGGDTTSVAIVTGAGQGIGEAIAEALAADGHRIVVADLDEGAARHVAARISAAGGSAVPKTVDIVDGASLDELFRFTEQECGGLDLLVNNAGITWRIDFADVTADDWDRINDVNAKGTFFCMQKAAVVMKRTGGGRIINIASIAAKGYPGTSNIAYAASKGSIIAMTRVASQLLGRDGITVNAICPGITRTALTAEATLSPQVGGTSVEELERNFTIPIGRANQPEDIASMAVFLASPSARNITGQSINVDGGLIFD